MNRMIVLILLAALCGWAVGLPVVSAQEEPPLPSGLDEPALPSGLDEEPALPPGLTYEKEPAEMENTVSAEWFSE